MLESRRLAAGGLLLLPAGLVVFFAFDAGGFYPGPPAYVAALLCLVLAVRATVARDPLEGFSKLLVVAVVAMAAFALFTLLSASWSHAPGRALVMFDLALVYLLALLLFGSIGRSAGRLRWVVRGLSVGVTAVCISALATRVAPDVFPTAYQLAENRLSFPITYWNVLGLLAAVGIVLCAHISSDRFSHPAERCAAAAVVPALASTLYFTFSRGSIGAAVVALTTYAVLARPRFLLSFLVAALPLTAIAVRASYDASLLAGTNPASTSGAAQGHHVARVLLICVAGAAAARAVLILLDRQLTTFSLRPEVSQRVVRVGWATLAVVGAIAVITLNGVAAREFHRFLSPVKPGNGVDLRTRLTDPGNDGRIELWRVAWHEVRGHPVVGQGAGTFANTWALNRPNTEQVQNAHSVYIETLDELGIVGFVLLVGTILVVLVGTVIRARGRHRPLYAAIFAVLLAWALETGIDWDWQMPVITVIFFALGGAALARPAPRTEPFRGFSPGARVPIGLGCLLLAVAPAYVWLSQRKLNAATAAYYSGNCPAAISASRSSISILGVRAEPYEILGYCELQENRPQLSLVAIHRAISLDPQNWNYVYDLALFRAAAGLNPKPAARRALALNPRETLTQQEWQTFSTSPPSRWASEARNMANSLGSLS